LQALSKKLGLVETALKTTKEKLRIAEEDRAEKKEDLQEGALGGLRWAAAVGVCGASGSRARFAWALAELSRLGERSAV